MTELTDTEIEMVEDARRKVQTAATGNSAASTLDDIIEKKGENAPVGLMRARDHIVNGSPEAAIEQLDAVLNAQ